MADSGILWVDIVFDLSVRWLIAWAKFFGITYEEINVWLFCIVWPIVTLTLIVTIWILQHKNKALRKRITSLPEEGSPAFSSHFHRERRQNSQSLPSPYKRDWC